MHIATIPKNSREELRVSLDHFRGHDLVNLRVWFDAGEGEMRPGKKGLAVRIAHLPDLIGALHDARQAAEGIGPKEAA